MSAILVVGGVRTGTSLAAGLLARLGFAVPDADTAGDEWNPAGSYRDLGLRHPHLMIAHAGLDAVRDEYLQIIAQRETGGNNWVSKEPGFLAVWEQVITLWPADIRVVLCERNRAESRDSLLARRGEGLEGPGFCERYSRETSEQSEAFAATIPRKRLLRVHFDEIAEPKRYATKLAAFVGREVSKEAEDFVRPEWRRFGGPTPDPTRVFVTVAPPVVEPTPDTRTSLCVHVGPPVRGDDAPDRVRDYHRCEKGHGVKCKCECGMVSKCGDYEAEDAEPDTKPRDVLLLHNGASPGDVMVMEAAIASLHAAHPGKFMTAVSSFANAIYDNHPHVVKPRDTDRIRRIDMHYPAVNQSNDRGIHFMQAYCEYLGETLGVSIPLAVNRPRLYLSAQERGWINQVEEVTGDKAPFWVVNAGRKSDFTAKWAGTAFYQAVVDATPGIRWVQIGEQNHHHPPLRGVVDLRGKTDTRQLIRLAWHARGGLGPSTFLQHVMAAHSRPYVCIAGGREPVQWLQYPMQTTFHSVGRYDCCRDRACWKSRTVPLGDGGEQDGSLCSLPVVDAAGDSVPRCLFDIDPAEVARAILSYRG